MKALARVKQQRHHYGFGRHAELFFEERARQGAFCGNGLFVSHQRAQWPANGSREGVSGIVGVRQGSSLSWENHRSPLLSPPFPLLSFGNFQPHPKKLEPRAKTGPGKFCFETISS